MRVALIGCGRIAYELERDALRYKPCTHLGALRYFQKRDTGLKLTGFCDTNPERAITAAAFMRADGAIITTDYREIIAQQPDLLVIASSTAAHHKALAAAIKAGVKRIVAEKPLVFSAAEARALKLVAESGKSIVLPNYERRYHEKYISLRREQQNVKKGDPYRAFFAAGGASLYPDTKTGDEGVLLHDTTHLVDLVQFIFGRITGHRIIAEKRRHVIYLTHESGSEGVIETSLGVGAFHLELQVMKQDERKTIGNGFTLREKIVASPHYRRLRGYAPAIRTIDKPMTTAKNPFLRLYDQALYGKPDNAHFFEALENVLLLSKQR